MALIIGANVLGMSVSRSLVRTNERVATAGARMTYVANVGREAGTVGVAAAQLPGRTAFDTATLRYALLLRQVAVTRVKAHGTPETEAAMNEVDSRLRDLAATFDALGIDPSQDELRLAKGPMLDQSGAVELAAKRLYDVSELELIEVGREATVVQRKFQLSMLAMGILASGIAIALLTSLRRRAGKELSVAYDELLAESHERQLAEVGLRRSSDRFRALVHNASDVITVVDSDGRISYQSPSVMAALGRSAEDLVGVEFLELVDDVDRECAEQRLAESLAQPGVPVLVELHLRNGDSSRLYEVTICSLLDDPAVAGVVLNYRDVTERKQFQRQLERQAYEDMLTGLPNRAHLQDALVRITREHHDVAVLFIDLDAFKVVNDSLGHAVGDQLLQAVAVRLTEGVRAGDLVARLGGDEFTVVVTDERVDSIHILADRLIRSLNEPFVLGEQLAFVGASIGIATSRDGERSPAALLRNADVAMYRAKAEGRNRQVLFASSLHDDAVDRLELQADLRRAIEEEEFELHYQPIRSLTSERVEGVEALIRWRKASGTLVLPDEFIPLAEEVGLMGQIGQWVLREACRARVDWGRRGQCDDHLAMSVNLSPQQFTDATLAAEVEAMLVETGLAPNLLVLEITESALIGDVPTSQSIILELREMGVRVALDDFGTGYSSLSHLRDLSIDAIKLDRSFVAEMCVRSQDALIIEAVVTLAHSLGMVTVAEGVETAEQLAALRRLGCDAVQGYLIARPVPSDQIPELLASSRVSVQPAAAP